MDIAGAKFGIVIKMIWDHLYNQGVKNKH